MAIVACKECGKDVSENALKCPSCGVQLNKPKRGFMGKLFKGLFILFNIVMLGLLVLMFMAGSDVASTAATDAEEAGAVLGAALGAGVILNIWIIGDIILGLFVLLTRPKG